MIKIYTAISFLFELYDEQLSGCQTTLQNQKFIDKLYTPVV